MKHTDSLLLLSNMPYKRSDYVGLAHEFARAASTRMNTSLHIAFVYGRGGTLLAMATNRIGSRSSGAGFSNATIHAERAALRAVGDTRLLKDAVLVVVRVGKTGDLKGSEPCHSCRCHLMKAFMKHGLKRVYYS
jgi:hypothetical protein